MLETILPQKLRLLLLKGLNRRIYFLIDLSGLLLFGQCSRDDLAAVGRKEFAFRSDRTCQQGLHPIVVFLGERFVLVVVAAGAVERQAERGGDENRLRVVE